MENNLNRFVFCESGRHSVPKLWWSSKPNRPSACKSCAMRVKAEINARMPKVGDKHGDGHYVSSIKKSNGAITATISPLKRTAIKKVSDKQQKINVAYTALRKAYIATHQECEAKLFPCTGKATDVHHLYWGSNKRKYYNDFSKVKAVCRECHSFIHDKMSSDSAIALGLRILDETNDDR